MTAIFGLVGVLLGGVLNGFLALKLEITGRRRHARAAARLVRVELQQTAAEIGSFSALLREWRDVDWPSAEWNTHRAVLAEVLSFADFEDVAGAYIHIEAWQKSARSTPGERIPDFSRDVMQDSLEVYKKAIFVLQSLASEMDRPRHRRWA